MNEHEQEFIKKVCNDLDTGLEQLDPSIAKRLRNSRRRAMDLAEKKPYNIFTIHRLIPVGGFAALAVVVVAASLWFSQRPQSYPSKAAEEIEVMTVPGSLDMYKDLEFYQWLAQTHETR